MKEQIHTEFYLFTFISMCCTKETPRSHWEGRETNRQWQKPPSKSSSKLSHWTEAKWTIPILAKWHTNLRTAALLCSKMAQVSRFCTVDGSMAAVRAISVSEWYFLNLLPPPVAVCVLTKGRTLLATICSNWCLCPPHCLKATLEFSLVTNVPICCLKAALIFCVFLFHLLGLQRPWRNGIAG